MLWALSTVHMNMRAELACGVQFMMYDAASSMQQDDRHEIPTSFSLLRTCSCMVLHTADEPAGKKGEGVYMSWTYIA
jgi:hypothetical protein